jgi:hypothetical protein
MPHTTSPCDLPGTAGNSANQSFSQPAAHNPDEIGDRRGQVAFSLLCFSFSFTDEHVETSKKVDFFWE